MTVEFSYRPDNLRLKRTKGTFVNYLIWDGGQIVAELYGTGELTDCYAYGLERIKSKRFNYFIQNGQGDILHYTNNSGKIMTSYSYDGEYGNVTGGNSNNPFRYRGEYYDTDLRLYYLRARWYDSALGEFISEDPVKDGVNWYVYCSNNPVKFRDPSGLAIIMDKEASLDDRKTITADLQQLTNHELERRIKKDKDGNVLYYYIGIKNEDTINTGQNLSNGNALISRLITNTKHMVEIKISDNNNTGRNDHLNAHNKEGTGSIVYYNPNKKSESFVINSNGSIEKQARPAFVGLAHELIHADHNMRGTRLYDNEVTISYRWGDNPNITTDYIQLREAKTIGIPHSDYKLDELDITENMIRLELGLLPRGLY